MKKLIRNKHRLFVYALIITFVIFNIVVFQSSFSSLLIDIYSLLYTFVFFYARLLGFEMNTPDTFYSLIIAKEQSSLLPNVGELYFNDVGFRVGNFFNMIFSSNYFAVALPYLLTIIQRIVLFISLLAIIIVLIVVAVNMYLSPSKSKDVGYTKAYLKLLTLYNLTVKKYFDFLKAEFSLLSEKEIKIFKVVIILTFLIDFRILSIAIELYYYLLITISMFSIESIYWAFRSMIIQFNFIISKCSIIGFIIILIFGFDKIKLFFAKKKLKAFDNKNKDFASKLGILISVLGFPGSGKTTMCVSLSQDFEQMQREKAFEIMCKYYHKFIDFNFAQFNIYLANLIKAHDIKNRVQLREKLKTDLLVSSDSFNSYFKYDTKSRRNKYYDGLTLDKIKPSLIIYAEAYFYYYSIKPRLYTNLTLNLFYRVENNTNYSLPIFKYTYLDDHKTDENLSDEIHRSSKLNLGFLSLGKKEDNKIGCIDSGVMFFTEADKEFGNKLTNSGVDRNAKKINVYNRLTDVYLMLCRHLHSIDSTPFFKYISDYQREGSLGASYAGITETTITINSNGTVKNVIPFWIYGRIISEFFVKHLEKFMDESLKYRQTKGIIDLLISKLYSLIAKRYYYRINSYNVTVKTMTVQGHSNDMPNKYYFIWKKIYSNAFKTDCYKDFFKPMYMDPERIFDSAEFGQDYPSREEFESMSSLFIKKLEGYD